MAEPMPSVAIIGGGLAGLAAATQLTANNIPVTLFEAAPQLGGRARGVSYQGQMLDNGQHILLGAYRETLTLMALAGVNESAAFVRLPLQLHMHALKNSPAIHLQASPALPAPLHILAAFLGAQGLPLGSKFAALRLMIWAQLHGFKLAQDIPLSTFLAQLKQTPLLQTAIWEPLCLAALNTPLREASAQVFLNVLRDSFARKKVDSDMLLPRTDLSALLAKPLANWLQARGAMLHTHSAIKQITQKDGQFLLDTPKSTAAFSQVIIACGPHQLAHMQLTRERETQSLQNLAPTFDYQPITTVYLQFNANTRLPKPMLGLYQSTAQWVFDRGAMCGQHGLLAVVISANQAASGLENAALSMMILAELKQIFPDLGEPIWTKVITEKFATFACTPALVRPTGQTPVENLYLTGDYVENGYPATIEGAVRNGLNVAKLITDSAH